MSDPDALWHPVALSTAVPAGVTRAVVLDGQEIVLWRGADGAPHAWEDRCPHRGMRLSYGFVRGSALNCLYHGWEYDGSSRCVRIPAHPDLDVPKTIKARSYALVEAGGLVWINLAGDAAPAAPSIDAGAPLISVAVDRPIADLRAFLRATSTYPAMIREDIFDGVALLLTLHPVGPAKTMLHALTIGGSDLPAARRSYAAAVRGLRDEAETAAKVA
jgi:nitrite reductase/ring-hydroxylating ferredoxin subunit